MTHQTTAEARDCIAEDLERVAETGEPVAFERDGKPVEEEDRLDNEAADEALKEPGSIPWEDIKAELGF